MLEKLSAIFLSDRNVNRKASFILIALNELNTPRLCLEMFYNKQISDNVNIVISDFPVPFKRRREEVYVNKKKEFFAVENSIKDQIAQA